MDWSTSLGSLIAETTRVYRKGDAVQRDGGVVTIDDMPPLPATQPAEEALVDAHFLWVSVRRAAAEERRRELCALLAEYPAPDRLAGGPSYLELGAELGDQGLALRLLALGEVLRLWRLFIPASFGITGDRAEAMAGQGYIVCSGWRP